MNVTILQAIRDLLKQEGITYWELQHPPTFTSEEAARARGEDLRIGGKALLIKVGDAFQLFVLSAALKVDSQAIRRHFQARKIRFATPAELQELTGLVPGSVPPFGKPILPFDLCVDPSILANQKIAFNAGSLETSIIMGVEDYIKISKPVTFSFALNT